MHAQLPRLQQPPPHIPLLIGEEERRHLGGVRLSQEQLRVRRNLWAPSQAVEGVHMGGTARRL